MGLFSNLMSRIFSHASSSAAAAPSAQTQPVPAASTPAPATAAAAAATAAAPQVDVAAILNDLAKKNPEKLDWQRSIVDLMKLVGMDSSFTARKQLAAELHYTGDPNDSASMNIWLHKEVMKKLAENGGKVPQDLLK
jgi:3-oxoacyl-ACP reductase-like protein